MAYTSPNPYGQPPSQGYGNYDQNNQQNNQQYQQPYNPQQQHQQYPPTPQYAPPPTQNYHQNSPPPSGYQNTYNQDQAAPISLEGQPQPGYVPQPHPPVTLYYSSPQQDSLLNPSSLSLEESAQEKPKCQDPCCAVFFILNMIAFAALIGYGISVSIGEVPTFNMTMSASLIFYAITALLSTIVSGAFLVFTRSNAAGIIICALILNAVSWIAVGIWLCIIQQYWGAVFIVFGLLMTLYPFCLRDRIKFVAVMIKYSISALNKYPGVFLVSTIGMAINIIVSVVALISAQRLFIYYNPDNGHVEGDHSGVTYTILTFFLFFIFWFSEFARAFIHTTIAGVVGTYWYLPTQTFATGPSFKRAATTSMGSIAFGSLLVALCRLGKAMARMKFNNLKSGNNKSGGLIVLLIILACISIIFSCFERCLSFINHFAYTQVALYGTSYVTSGKRTIELFFNSGFTMIIQKDLTSFVISIGALLSTIVSVGGLAGIYYASSAFPSHWEVNQAAYVISTGVIIAFYTAIVMLTPLSSAVTATWVCWAEDGESLNTNHPEAFAEMAAAKNKVLGL